MKETFEQGKKSSRFYNYHHIGKPKILDDKIRVLDQ